MITFILHIYFNMYPTSWKNVPESWSNSYHKQGLSWRIQATLADIFLQHDVPNNFIIKTYLKLFSLEKDFQHIIDMAHSSDKNNMSKRIQQEAIYRSMLLVESLLAKKLDWLMIQRDWLRRKRLNGVAWINPMNKISTMQYKLLYEVYDYLVVDLGRLKEKIYSDPMQNIMKDIRNWNLHITQDKWADINLFLGELPSYINTFQHFKQQVYTQSSNKTQTYINQHYTH